MYGFHVIVSTLCVRDVRDTQCGFKLFDRTAAKRVFTPMHIERWAFDVELLYVASRCGLTVKVRDQSAGSLIRRGSKRNQSIVYGLVGSLLCRKSQCSGPKSLAPNSTSSSRRSPCSARSSSSACATQSGSGRRRMAVSASPSARRRCDHRFEDLVRSVRGEMRCVTVVRSSLQSNSAFLVYQTPPHTAPFYRSVIQIEPRHVEQPVPGRRFRCQLLPVTRLLQRQL